MAAFVLNFNGRVTMASVKNFQLVLEEDGAVPLPASCTASDLLAAAEEHVVLQFGKVGKDEFTMDYRWPMSPLQVATAMPEADLISVVCTCAGFRDLLGQLRQQTCL